MKVDNLLFESIVIIYSAIIASLAFFWNIYDYYKKSRNYLKIDVDISGYKQVSNIPLLLNKSSSFTSNIVHSIMINIINIGFTDILIYEQPKVEFRKNSILVNGSLISTSMKSYGINFNQIYPIKLLPGEKIILRSENFEVKENTCFKIVIKDSKERFYKIGKFYKINQH